jgi:hypothetical protein
MTFKPSTSFLIILSFLSFGLTFKVTAQKLTKSDTLDVYKTVAEFYDWYLKAPKKNKNSEFQPAFVKSDKGMTTLDFSKYLGNLKKYNFSDSLINKEKMSYQPCIDSLEKIKFSDFTSNYVDLDDFERINCDFGNSFRWIGGQEAIDGVKISHVKFETSTYAIVTVERTGFDSQERKVTLLGSFLVTLTKVQAIWKIQAIHI